MAKTGAEGGKGTLKLRLASGIIFLSFERPEADEKEGRECPEIIEGKPVRVVIGSGFIHPYENLHSSMVNTGIFRGWNF